MEPKPDLQAQVTGLTIGTTFALGVLVEELAARDLVSKTDFAETLRWIIEEDQRRRPTSVPAQPRHEAAPELTLVFATARSEPDLLQACLGPAATLPGFSTFEYSISAKCLELLKQITLSLTRVAVIRDSHNPDGIGQVCRRSVRGAAKCQEDADLATGVIPSPHDV